MIKTKNKCGFTLIEAMVALSIASISIIAVLTFTTQSFRIINNMRDFSRANQILQQEMEDLRMVSFSSLISTIPYTKNKGKFTLSTEKATYRTDGNNVVVLKVTVYANWTDYIGKSRKMSMSTIFSSGGLNLYIF